MLLSKAIIVNHVDPKSRNIQINLSTLAIVRSLGRREIPVTLVTTSPYDGISRSRFVRETVIGPSIHSSEEKLLDFLKGIAQSEIDRPVLIPAVDETSYFVGKFYDSLENYFRIPAPSWNAIKHINNKRDQYLAARSLDIPIPETYYPDSIEDIQKIAVSLTNYPYVIKPNISFEWRVSNSKSQGKKAIVVHGKQELIEKASDLFGQTKELMIQEIIGGRDDHLVTCLSYFDANHRPNSWFIRKKYRQNPIDFGYCTMTESCHNDQVFNQTKSLLQHINYHGISGVEWKLDPATNKFKLIEINARPVNTTGCAIASGVDLPSIAYFDAIGHPLPSVTDWRDGQLWVWLAQDFWAAREHIRNGDLTFKDWLFSLRKIKSDAVFSFDDPALSFSYYWRFIVQTIRQKFFK